MGLRCESFLIVPRILLNSAILLLELLIVFILAFDFLIEQSLLIRWQIIYTLYLLLSRIVDVVLDQIRGGHWEDLQSLISIEREESKSQQIEELTATIGSQV